MPSNTRRFFRHWFLIVLCTPLPALAYIDPNTGGMIFQVLAPILAMITSAWLFLRDRIKSLWYKLRRIVFQTRAEEAAAPEMVDPS